MAMSFQLVEIPKHKILDVQHFHFRKGPHAVLEEDEHRQLMREVTRWLGERPLLASLDDYWGDGWFVSENLQPLETEVETLLSKQPEISTLIPFLKNLKTLIEEARKGSWIAFSGD